MRTNILCGVSFAMLIAALGCGGGDSGESDAVASNSSTPPAPPSAPAAASPAAAPATAAPSSSGAEGSSSPDGSAYPGGSASPGGYPGGPGGYPGGSDGSGGYPGGSPPPSGYPGGSATPTGYPGGSPIPGPYPGGSDAAGYPSGYPGASADGSGAPLLARPKSLRQKAVDAFREGRGDEGVQLLSAHYLTNPAVGSELGRVMQYSPGLRKPTLVTRIGLAVVYSSQPPTYEGHPQPIGSPEVEAALATMERATGGNREGAGREGGNPRVGGRRRLGGGGGEGNPGASGPPGGSGLEGGAGYGGAQNQLPTTPEEELKYFTGEVGTKLVAKIRTKLEAGEFGAIYREALKSLPLADNAAGQEGGDFSGRSGPGGPGAVGPDGELRSAPPIPGGGRNPDGTGGGPGQPGGQAGESGGIVTGQVVPGVEFLGAVENVKELGELIKSSSVDAVIYFEVRVRPATANAFVNNDTRMRLVAAADPTNQLHKSPATLNNKKVYEVRKDRNAEDPVAKEVDAVVAALETSFKHVPLPALSAEQVQQRINYLLKSKPEDATSLLLETRLFVAKKLLKPEDAVTLALTAVSDDQLSSISDVIEEGDVKELLGSALTGKRADAPTTVLGKFGAALSGAGGIGNLVPTPQMPPMVMPPPGAGGPGGYGPASGYPQSGYPSGLPPPGNRPESGSSGNSSGFSPAPGGPPPERGGFSQPPAGAPQGTSSGDR